MQAKVVAHTMLFVVVWWFTCRLHAPIAFVTVATAVVFLDVDSASVSIVEALKLNPTVRTSVRVIESTRLSSFACRGKSAIR